MNQPEDPTERSLSFVRVACVVAACALLASVLFNLVAVRWLVQTYAR